MLAIPAHDYICIITIQQKCIIKISMHMYCIAMSIVCPALCCTPLNKYINKAMLVKKRYIYSLRVTRLSFEMKLVARCVSTQSKWVEAIEETLNNAVRLHPRLILHR